MEVYILDLTKLKQPKMIIFDYGHTLLYEPGHNPSNGNKAVYDYISKKKAFNEEDKNVLSFAIISLVKLMSPVTVHMSEEIWTELGGKTSIHEEPWCEWDENLAKASKITLVVQVNGKVKDKLEANEGATNEELKTLALESEKIKELTSGKEIVKVIVVPNKLVNIVIK